MTKLKKNDMKDLLELAFPKRPKAEVEEVKQNVLARIKEELAKTDTSLLSLYGDGWSAEPLNEREYPILAAVSESGGGDLGRVFQTASQWAANMQPADVYIVLDKLKDRGLVEERGSLYQISTQGTRALRRAKAEGKELVLVPQHGFNACRDNAR